MWDNTGAPIPVLRNVEIPQHTHPFFFSPLIFLLSAYKPSIDTYAQTIQIPTCFQIHTGPLAVPSCAQRKWENTYAGSSQHINKQSCICTTHNHTPQMQTYHLHTYTLAHTYMVHTSTDIPCMTKDHPFIWTLGHLGTEPIPSTSLQGGRPRFPTPPQLS